MNCKMKEMEKYVRRFLDDELTELERLLRIICENVIYNL